MHVYVVWILEIEPGHWAQQKVSLPTEPSFWPHELKSFHRLPKLVFTGIWCGFISLCFFSALPLCCGALPYRPDDRLVFASGGHTASSPVWKPLSVCGSTVGSLGVFSSILMLSEVLNVWGVMISVYGKSVRVLVSVATLISYWKYIKFKYEVWIRIPLSYHVFRWCIFPLLHHSLSQ